MAQTEPWSFEDDVLNDMGEEQIRRIPQNCEHSVAWLIWHMARIEDVTMNRLVAGSPQILHKDKWLERIRATVSDTGNAMDKNDVADLSAQIDIKGLRAYRLAVGREAHFPWD
ncbi:MAG: DinB family protein [Anaerolineaceae bacterium]|nr:MAG: DinB family protein [Anaerolineaceae bacterium]